MFTDEPDVPVVGPSVVVLTEDVLPTRSQLLADIGNMDVESPVPCFSISLTQLSRVRQKRLKTPCRMPHAVR